MDYIVVQISNIELAVKKYVEIKRRMKIKGLKLNSKKSDLISKNADHWNTDSEDQYEI